MFRLFRAELKKIFLKPSIFVVTGLIIFMLAASIFLYSPKTKDEEYVEYNATNLVTVNDYYNYFNTSSVYDAKTNLDYLLDRAEASLNFYKSETNVVEILKQQWLSVKSIYDGTNSSIAQSDYISLYNINERDKTDSSKNDLTNKRNELKAAVNNFMNTYSSYLNSENTSFLVTPNLNEKLYNEHLMSIVSYFSQAEKNADDPDTFLINNFRNSGLFSLVSEDLSQLLPFTPNVDDIDNLFAYINEAKARNEAQLEVIVNFKNEYRTSNNNVDIKQFMDYITDYDLNATYAYNIVLDSIKISGLSNYTAIDITKFKNFENISLYQLQEKNTRLKFLFDNKTYQYNYADPYSIIQPSNTNINGYDYSYFALRLCTFFITIYIVVLAAGTIAGEQSNGTLKLLAIRPFGRNKLLSAKILATITIGAILIFVSGIASLVIGGVTYGLESKAILVVFNASKAFAMSPVLLYLIAMLTMFLEVLFYSMISIFISTVFKSNVAAVSISTLLFFLSLVLNVIAVSQPWLGLIPFVNVNMFKFFGSSFLTYATGKNLLQSILTPTVFAGSTIVISSIIYLISIVAITILTHVVFKKRDIK